MSHLKAVSRTWIQEVADEKQQIKFVWPKYAYLRV